MNQDSPGPVPSSLEITVAGPVASSVSGLLRDRYDRVSVTPGSGTDTVLTITNVDQASERAVLTLLWDTGHELRSVRRAGS